MFSYTTKKGLKEVVRAVREGKADDSMTFQEIAVFLNSNSALSFSTQEIATLLKTAIKRWDIDTVKRCR